MCQRTKVNVRFIPVFFLLFLVQCSVEPPATNENAKKEPPSNEKVSVSIISLISNPEDFNERTVHTYGFLMCNEDTQALFHTKSDAVYGIRKAGIRLEKGALDFCGRFHGKIVLMICVFVWEKNGKWAGCFREISRLEQSRYAEDGTNCLEGKFGDRRLDYPYLAPNGFMRTSAMGNKEGFFAVFPKADSGFLLAGTNDGSNHPFLMKIDSWCNEVWCRRVISEHRILVEAIDSREKEAVLVGYTGEEEWKSRRAEEREAWIAKVDGFGHPVWEKTHQELRYSRFEHVVFSEDGRIFVGGNQKKKRARAYQSWVLKLDQNGDIIWSRTYPGGENCGIQVGAGKHLYMVEELHDDEVKRVHATGRIRRLDLEGEQVWERKFGTGQFSEYIHEFHADREAGFGLVSLRFKGDTTKLRLGDAVVYRVRRFDVQGVLIWEREFLDHDFVRYIASVWQQENGSMVISGVRKSQWSLDDDAFIMEFGPQGDILWEKTLGGVFLEAPSDMVESAGGFVLVGSAGRDTLYSHIESRGLRGWICSFRPGQSPSFSRN